MDRQEALEKVRALQAIVRRFVDGSVDRGDLRELNREMRKLRKAVKREVQAALDDPDKMDIVFMLYAVLSAAELALLAWRD